MCIFFKEYNANAYNVWNSVDVCGSMYLVVVLNTWRLLRGIMAALKIPDDATLTPDREDIITGEYSESTYCWTKESGIAAAAASNTTKTCIIG